MLNITPFLFQVNLVIMWGILLGLFISFVNNFIPTPIITFTLGFILGYYVKTSIQRACGLQLTPDSDIQTISVSIETLCVIRDITNSDLPELEKAQQISRILDIPFVPYRTINLTTTLSTQEKL